MLAARAAGATPIVVTDIAQSRLDFAKKLVPEVKTVLVERGMKPEDVAARVKQDAGLAAGISVALECTGVESSVQTAIYASKFGGVVFVIGCGKDFQNLPLMHCSVNEIDLKFQYRYANQYSKAIRTLSSSTWHKFRVRTDCLPAARHPFAAISALLNKLLATQRSGCGWPDRLETVGHASLHPRERCSSVRDRCGPDKRR